MTQPASTRHQLRADAQPLVHLDLHPVELLHPRVHVDGTLTPRMRIVPVSCVIHLLRQQQLEQRLQCCRGAPPIIIILNMVGFTKKEHYVYIGMEVDTGGKPFIH